MPSVTGGLCSWALHLLVGEHRFQLFNIIYIIRIYYRRIGKRRAALFPCRTPVASV